ncbi:MAG: 4-hydroxy-tetrahydrodipicolinate reductase [Fervidobacterium sp.]
MKYGVVGFKGKMGREIVEYFSSMNDELVAKYDVDLEEVNERPEVLVDFSNRKALDRTIGICEELSCPLVIGTTALSENDFEKLKKLSEKVPVVQSYNFSEGVAIVKAILEVFASYFDGWDGAIVEVHHNEKKDTPSGTAIVLKNAIGKDIPISSLRIGGVFGEHTIIFANRGEVVEISHKALSRRAFSLGVRKAALYALTKTSGFYTYSDVLKAQIGGDRL